MSMSINLGLDRIRNLLVHLPTYTRPTCHIAGTNGKGSVSALLSAILAASSYRIGRFNSPHLVSVYDSITIDNEPVSAAKYAEVRARVEETNDAYDIGASSFELLTATAMMIFEDVNVDVTIMEVGMGGRLDATNAIPDSCVLVSALTAVDLDHQAFLGNTVTDIAFEKASIARPGKPFVLGPQKHKDVGSVVRAVVANVGGSLVDAVVPITRAWSNASDGPHTANTALFASTFEDTPSPIAVDLPPFPETLRLLLPLRGAHQVGNLGVALTMVSTLLINPDLSTHFDLDVSSRITPHTVAQGVKTARWPGRLSFHKIAIPIPPTAGPVQGDPPVQHLVLADGAHNPASSATLAAAMSDLLAQTTCDTQAGLARKSRRITLTYVLALSHSPPKTPLQTLTPLFAPFAEGSPFSTSTPAALDVRIRVALLEFSPPEGMPWVRSEPVSELRAAVRSLLPQADVWSPANENPLSADDDLREALNWAAHCQQTEAGGMEEGLIIVAGSLYLVADFYRLLRSTQ